MDAAAEKLERIIGFEELQILTVIFYGRPIDAALYPNPFLRDDQERHCVALGSRSLVALLPSNHPK